MKKHIFKDADNDLMWDIIPSINEKEPNNKQTLNRINKYTKYLNTWNDKDIIKFIHMIIYSHNKTIKSIKIFT